MEEAEELYGVKFISYYVHNLVHLTSDSEYFGCNLDKISSFPFENYLQVLKKFVRGTNNPLAKVVKRMGELDEFSIPACKEISTTISPGIRNGCFLLRGRKICLVEEVRDDQLDVQIVEMDRLVDFYEEPCKSSIFNVFLHKFRLVSKHRSTISWCLLDLGLKGSNEFTYLCWQLS